MKKCPSCGRENLDDARFCSNCGKDISIKIPSGSTFNDLTVLNPHSTYDEILSTAKMVLSAQAFEIVSSIDSIRAAHETACLKVPVDKFDNNAIEPWEYIIRVQSDILDLERAFKLQLMLFQTLFGVAYQGLENGNY